MRKFILLSLLFLLSLSHQVNAQNFNTAIEAVVDTRTQSLNWQQSIQRVKDLFSLNYRRIKTLEREIINDSLLVFQHKGKTLQFDLTKLSKVFIIKKEPRKINSNKIVHSSIIQLHFEDTENKYHGIYLESDYLGDYSFNFYIRDFASVFQHLADLRE